MKKIILTLATLLSIGAVSAKPIAQSWQITNTYSIKFSSDASSGIFKTFKGSISFDDKDLASSSFNVSIDVASINTGNAMMNKHAKGDEWFDATKYPQIVFTSKKIVKSGASYLVTGDLTMHGTTKEMTIPFAFVNKGAAATFTGNFSVNRTDFKIGKPGGEVSDAIKISVAVPVAKK